MTTKITLIRHREFLDSEEEIFYHLESEDGQEALINAIGMDYTGHSLGFTDEEELKHSMYGDFEDVAHEFCLFLQNLDDFYKKAQRDKLTHTLPTSKETIWNEELGL